MLVEQIWTNNAWRNFNYLIACPETGDALAIDPLNYQQCADVAASNGCLAAAKCLVRLSASTMAKDGPLCDGMLPYQVAEMWGEIKVAEFLRKSMEQFQVDIKRASMSTDKAAKQWLEQVQLTLQAKH